MRIVIYYDTDVILERFEHRIPWNRCVEPKQDYNYMVKKLESLNEGATILIEYPELFKTLPEIFDLCKDIVTIAREKDLTVGIKTKLEDVILPFLKFVGDHDLSVDELKVIYRGREKKIYEDGTIDELEDSIKFASSLW